MILPNATTPGAVARAEGQNSNPARGSVVIVARMASPSSIFAVLDRIDRNAAQVLALLRGGI